MIRPLRVGLLAVATVASALLVAGPAVAQEKPPVGSSQCTALVDQDPDVAKAVDDAAKEQARQEAESKLCATTAEDSSPTPADSPEPPAAPDETPPDAESSTDSESAPDSDAPAANRRVVPGNDAPAPKRAGRPAGDRDCADFATQQQAQRYFESIGGSATNNADRLDANGNGVACESLADDGDNQDAEATATGDDGSTAKTSGDQVTEVPEGSAQTGGA
jgi:hypothetical protein